MVTTKMFFINVFHKELTKVSFHISTIWGTKPDNLSLLNLMLGLTWNICDVIMKFTIFKNNVAIRSCFIEVILSQEFLEM